MMYNFIIIHAYKISMMSCYYPTDGAFISNVTVAVVSAIHARSPVTISCTILLTGTIVTISDDVTVDISWSKYGVKLHNSSGLVITSSYATKMLYHSNLTILVLETSDSGMYSCWAQLSQSTQTPTVPPMVNTIYLAVEGINYY